MELAKPFILLWAVFLCHTRVEINAEHEHGVFNVKEFGAVGDGVHNDTDALLSAIKQSQLLEFSTIIIPEGEFLIWPVLFESCKNLRLQIDGSLLAPQRPQDWTSNTYFLGFLGKTENCSITGNNGGQINGRGQPWWENPDLKDTPAPALLYFSGDVQSYPYVGVYNISLKAAPGAHVMVVDTAFYNFVEFEGLQIESTDAGKVVGVAAHNASFVLRESSIDVGAANVLAQAGDGDSNRVFCRVESSRIGRGKGLVIRMTDGILANSTFSQLSFEGTDFGLQVLGDLEGSGEIVDVFFNQNKMSGVGIPLVIDNTYCPPERTPCTRQAKGVKIQPVMIEQLDAVQQGGSAGRFICRQDNQCSIYLDQIDIRPSAPGVPNQFFCENAQGQSWEPKTISPKSCLKKPS